MIYEVEINENSENGRKFISLLKDLNIPIQAKSLLLEEQKYLLNESLNEVAEGKVMFQDEVIAEFMKWRNSK